MINRYFLICLLSLCGGIAFYVYGNAFLMISEIIILLFLFVLKRRNVFLISIIFALIGAILSNMALNIDAKILYSFVDGKAVSGTLQVTDIIYQSDKSVTCTAKVTRIENKNCKENIKLNIYTEDKIMINGIYNFTDMKINLNSKDEMLRYGSGKTFFNAFTSTSKLSFKGIANNGIINKLRNLRTLTNDYITSIFSKDVGALICALYTGETVNISSHYKNIFTDIGINHILSVSGFHVVLIMGFFDIFLKRFGKINYIKYIILIIFVIFTGTSPAIVRAAGMYIFVGVAQIFKRDSDSINNLALIALVSLLINPLLLFDKSFQLSYLATYGIMAVSPMFYIKADGKVLNFFSKALATTIAAQIMTLPIVLTLNSKISLVSIAANAFVTFLTPLLYGSSFLTMLLPIESLKQFCEIITKGMFTIIEFMSDGDIFSFEFTNINASIIISSVVVIAIFFISVERKSRVKRKRIKKMMEKDRENQQGL